MKFMKDQTRIIDIASGDDNCLAIDDEYNVYPWGENYHGQLARNDGLFESVEPDYIERSKEYKILKIQCGKQHCCARSVGGEHISLGTLCLWTMFVLGRLRYS